MRLGALTFTFLRRNGAGYDDGETTLVRSCGQIMDLGVMEVNIPRGHAHRHVLAYARQLDSALPSWCFSR